jgi:hypothetical protein
MTDFALDEPLVLPFYRLDGKEPVRCETWREYLDYMLAADGSLHIANDEAPGCRISTIFLISPSGVGIIDKPYFFETMIFGGPLDGTCKRYHSYDEALAGHAGYVLKLKSR